MSKTVLFFFLASTVIFARESTSSRTVELKQLAIDLTNSAVLVALSAHPDDEDGATLAYYRKRFGVKTYSIFFTRGEGGQNEIGPELYKDLGVIRTQETEEAARLLGTDVYFLNFIDFGYSKTATETFKKWGGRTAVLERLVYLIRKLKPDVIITNHNPTDDHGNHQAVAIAAIEGFDAGADGTFSPDQLREEGIDLWQPKKFFWRVWNPTSERIDVANDIGAEDTLRHQSYQEIALSALSSHRSQGMDKFALLLEITRGAKSFYRLIRSSSRFENDSSNFFGGIDLFREDPSLGRISEKLRGLIPEGRFPSVGKEEDFITRLESILADTSLRLLREVTVALGAESCSKEYSPLQCRTVKLWNEIFRQMITVRYDLSFKVDLSDSIVVPGQRFGIRVANVSPRELKRRFSYDLRVPSGWVAERDGEKFTLTVPRTASTTLPAIEGFYRTFRRARPVVLIATLDGVPNLSLEIPLMVSIAPHQTLTVEPKVSRLKEGGNEFRYEVHNYFNNKTAGRLRVDLPQGWWTSPAEFIIDKEDGEISGKILIFPDQQSEEGDYRIVFHAHDATDTVLIRKFGVETSKNVYVGIVKSYDNTLENALKELRAKFKLLDEGDLKGDLAKFTSIIVDIRAYLVREDLRRNNPQLLQYVKDGGNLIVMYHKDLEWKSDYAPFPLEISRERVVAETAPIRILQPSHPLFTSPNRISQPDWDGWVHERGLYFPRDYSEEYLELLSSNDPDEKPLNGGFLIAKFGKGTYIYTSYVWYRQWKDVHPGALRNLANIISLPIFRSEP